MGSRVDDAVKEQKRTTEDNAKLTKATIEATREQSFNDFNRKMAELEGTNMKNNADALKGQV